MGIHQREGDGLVLGGELLADLWEAGEGWAVGEGRRAVGDGRVGVGGGRWAANTARQAAQARPGLGDARESR